MIRYALICAEGHRFDSWFQSASAFETLCERGLVVCETCGSTDVKKALMAPGVSSGDAAPDMAAKAPAPAQTMASGPLSAPGSPLEQMLTKIREQVEANSTYVGRDFAQEARDMHLGETPERQIHGEATQEEAQELMEDGVPILPLPVLPKSKAN